MIVLDANVVAKWFVPEPGSDEAKSFIEYRGLIFAPFIIRIEVLSIILRSIRQGRTTDAEASTFCKVWLKQLEQGMIFLEEEIDLRELAMQMAAESGHHLIDCFYLALAHRRNATLQTYDRKLAAVALRMNVQCRLLEEASSSIP